jgi:hypothetical protein
MRVVKILEIAYSTEKQVESSRTFYAIDDIDAIIYERLQSEGSSNEERIKWVKKVGKHIPFSLGIDYHYLIVSVKFV